MSLGVVAGKRDFLNYDAWLRERILNVGSIFLRSLVHYFFSNLFRPIQEQLIKANIGGQALPNQNTGDEEKTSQIIEGVLEKANLTKARLNLTIEILQNHLNESPNSSSED